MKLLDENDPRALLCWLLCLIALARLVVVVLDWMVRTSP
jgi:hypothetical protein